MKRLTFQVSNETFKMLKILAVEKNISLKTLMTLAIELLTNDKEVKK